MPVVSASLIGTATPGVPLATIRVTDDEFGGVRR
jgi:hypothetical protein